jgi:hypothetical protein
MNPLRVLIPLVASAALTACGGGSDVARSDGGAVAEAPIVSSSPPTPSPSAIESTSLADGLEPFCAELLASIGGVDPVDATMNQVARVKRELENVRASVDDPEVERWYRLTTDLVGAAFNRVNAEDVYTKAWAEWTMGAKVGIQSECR